MSFEIKYIKQNFGPGKGSWIIATVGTCIVLGFLCLADSVLDSYWLAKLQDKLENNLQVVRHSSQLMEDRQLRSILVSEDGDASAGLKEVFHTLELIEEGHYDRALVKLQKRTFPNISKKEQLLDHLTKINSAKTSTEEGGENINKLNGKKRSLDRQLELSTNDLLLIFKKDRVELAQKPNWDKESVKLYKSGPLSGLPVLEGLPEKIENKQDLAPFLEGSYVDETGKHLENLRTRMAKINTEAERYQFIAKNAKSDLDDTGIEIQKLKLKTRKLISQSIFELAKPKKDEQNKWLYEHATQLAGGAGYELPKVSYQEK